ncbi:Bug family tripartite tricarboxylate transporter substrate binding protein [Falsiroseomonas tokyonensis]|uniref:Bug family tripartite tricarboxylate transporter substrate binding protein n=1 Tax=Falsiroseomonas tokyonensis TaxID=430521 RepID=A0ABV7BSU1_9PROT|nr:tripartite tricarboxylate transporter substrate binding protein [Falsiroseomonas tokyonensis]MBU8538703.1 tripartite tricarboxylate transporter substrate binding protein [Falsiroseomonas tokyonensis]
MPNTAIGRRSALGIAAACLSGAALAQARFPDRPIRVIVPFPPGGTTDVQMRVLAEGAARRLGQPVVIENRPGAGGSMGAAALAQNTRADGYTLSVMPNSIFRIPVMMARPSYDPMVDFTWVIRLVGYTFGIVVRADSPFQTLGQMLDHARANPGALTYGSPGVATLDVTMERIAQMAGGLRLVHVPFRGSAESLQALLAGQVDMAAESSAWGELVLDGRLRLLATWGEARPPRFAMAPTLREAGIDIVNSSPYGLAAPRGLDPAVVAVLHDAFRDALQDPAHLAVLERYNMPMMYADGEAYARYAQEFYAEDSAMVRAMGLKF